MKHAIPCALAILLTACAGLYGPETRQGVSSSLVDYLYPKGEIPPRSADPSLRQSNRGARRNNGEQLGPRPAAWPNPTDSA
jgi:hypothetical protein